MEEINQGTQANLVRALSSSRGVVSKPKQRIKSFVPLLPLKIKIK